MTAHSIPLKRWIAKKAARVAMGAGTFPITMTATAGALRVLTYHRYADEPRSPFAVSGADLEQQMRWLSETGRAAAPASVERALAGGTASGCLVTMDDGDPSVYDIAAPIFERHAIPYIVYAVPGRIGQKDHMTPAQLRTLSDRGAVIGSHSMSHRSMASLSSAELRTELADSKKILEDITGRPVTSFAYPFGTLRDFNRDVADALREEGYAFALTSQHGPVQAGQDPMMVPRIKIEGGDPDWLFRAACKGAMDTWRLIDAGLSGLQKPEAKDLSLSKAAAAAR
jgi:peptidoglycan/xylan/chitin deacetylase (PgdA/CDA1 family)